MLKKYYNDNNDNYTWLQIYGVGPLGYKLPIVPKTVIPIDKSSCVTTQPPTTGKTINSMCIYMYYTFMMYHVYTSL